MLTKKNFGFRSSFIINLLVFEDLLNLFKNIKKQNVSAELDQDTHTRNLLKIIKLKSNELARNPAQNLHTSTRVQPCTHFVHFILTSLFIVVCYIEIGSSRRVIAITVLEKTISANQLLRYL